MTALSRTWTARRVRLLATLVLSMVSIVVSAVETHRFRDEKRYFEFFEIRDELPADIAVRDSPYYPLPYIEPYRFGEPPLYLIYSDRDPYEVLDYTWRCCFMDKAEILYIRAYTERKIYSNKTKSNYSETVLKDFSPCE